MNNKIDGIQLTIGEILTDLRDKKGETQKQVAEATGISEASLCNYENNSNFPHKAHIRFDYICKLAKHYGVPINYFMGNPSDTELVASSTETEIATDQLTSNDLIDIFEDAIDKNHIDEFMKYDFSFTPLQKGCLDAICEFIWELQIVLPKFRRNQDSTYGYIIDFINTISDYLYYLGERMDTDDGETFHCLRNIDFQKAQEDTVSFRTKLNELYGLISNGGTFAIFRA
jgi:transcriptional regulator with XRE-family HTH domain